MKRFSFLILLIALFTQVHGQILFAASSTDSMEINLGVDGCNNNSICEPGLGEDVLSCPNDCSVIIVPPPNGGPHGGSSLPFIYAVTVQPTIDQATIHFLTRAPVFATLSWGETTDYNTGLIHSTIFVTDHTFILTGLKPSTYYFFKIECQDRNGNMVGVYNGTFLTISLPQKHIVPNPYNVGSQARKEGITLTWDNPTDRDLDYIRIMRNTDRFHSSPLTGTLVYEGSVEHMTDTNILVGQKYYYTLYTHETSGEYSSGVGIIASYNNSEPAIAIPPPLEEKNFFPYFIFLQHDELIKIKDNIGYVVAEEPIEVRSITGTFVGFQDLWAEIKYVSGRDRVDTKVYLFAYDSSNKIYHTYISPLFSKGDYEVRIYGFNQDHTALLSSGMLHVSVGAQIPTSKSLSLNDLIVWLFWILLFLLIILWLEKTNEVVK